MSQSCLNIQINEEDEDLDLGSKPKSHTAHFFTPKESLLDSDSENEEYSLLEQY
jgi:hypothetical protein